MDLDAVLCFKERRKVAKDNTVQYHGQTLQIFPGPERRTYARAHVEVQERLDGRLMVCHRGNILTPGEAPPLAATLRVLAATGPNIEYEMLDTTDEEIKAVKKRTGLGWDGDWYLDESKRTVHGDMVRAGMERARQRGKRIGRPRVTDRPDFAQRFAAAIELIRLGELSLTQAAKYLDIGYATLKRLMDDKNLPLIASDTGKNEYAEVV